MAKKKLTTDVQQHDGEDDGAGTQTVRLDTEMCKIATSAAALVGLSLPKYINSRMWMVLKEEYPRLAKAAGQTIENVGLEGAGGGPKPNQ